MGRMAPRSISMEVPSALSLVTSQLVSGSPSVRMLVRSSRPLGRADDSSAAFKTRKSIASGIDPCRPQMAVVIDDETGEFSD